MTGPADGAKSGDNAMPQDALNKPDQAASQLSGPAAPVLPSLTGAASETNRPSTNSNIGSSNSEIAVATTRSDLPSVDTKEPPAPPTPVNRPRKPTGPPSLHDLCKIGGTEFPTPRSNTVDQHMREEIKYMYMHEYADGLNKLLETQWYTTNGLDRLFANFQLQQQFAGTLELFSSTKNNNFDEYIRLPPTERKLVTELMLLPMKVANPNPGDTELQTVISRLHVLDCLLTGRVIQSSPTSLGGLPQPGMDTRQSHFWKFLGECITHATLCNPQYGVPSWSNAFDNASNALAQMKLVLDGLENRDVLYSMAVLRHLGPRHLQAIARAEGIAPDGQVERMRVAVAKKFLEDEASGAGTTQVIQRICGMLLTGLSHWQLL
ncbi:MAG: hypothetical protein Q9159_002908 [Coniocarpon cinnabarinum]